MPAKVTTGPGGPKGTAHDASDTTATGTPAVAVEVSPAAVVEVITRIANSTSISEVWDQGCVALGWFGLDRLDYGFTRFRHDNAMGDPADALYLTNRSAAEAEAYYDSGLYRRTPMFRWVSENVGVCSWRWAGDQYRAGTLNEDETRATEEILRQGVRAGYSIAFAPTSARSKGAMGMGAPEGMGQDELDEIWASFGDQIQAIANTMHLKITQLPYPVHRRPLTDRQREALEWVADGKTTQDIAMLMEISSAMVEKHLRLAREALSVETTAQAVAKASVLNQIFVVGTGAASAPKATVMVKSGASVMRNSPQV